MWEAASLIVLRYQISACERTFTKIRVLLLFSIIGMTLRKELDTNTPTQEYFSTTSGLYGVESHDFIYSRSVLISTEFVNFMSRA